MLAALCSGDSLQFCIVLWCFKLSCGQTTLDTRTQRGTLPFSLDKRSYASGMRKKRISCLDLKVAACFRTEKDGDMFPVPHVNGEVGSLTRSCVGFVRLFSLPKIMLKIMLKIMPQIMRV